ncbi:MAG TPA: BatA domain-containing protein [Gemmatimonadales bacterium]|nr:BatA domain-containing protein [Gemmatimonadales bacterium]
MTFAAPLWLAAAGVVAAMVVGLHLLSRRSPRTYRFPTARFIPDRPASAPAPATRPTDLLLLLLRVAAVLLLGAAFARPHIAPPHRLRTIVAIDRSRSAAAELDSAAVTAVRDADVVLAFDSVATTVTSGGEVPPASQGHGSLSVALIAAMRAAPRLAESGDSIELVIVSPFAMEEWDEATLAIRRSWAGSIRLVPMAGASPTVVEGGGLRAGGNDPVVASVALLQGGLPSGTRLIRTEVTAADSAWAREGGTLVYWPARDSTWPRKDGPATGVVAGGYAAVAPFAYRTELPTGRVVARWGDGAPAATERPLGAGCERDVGIPLPAAGDIALRPGMLRLVRQLTGACGGARADQPVTPGRLDSLRGTGGLLASSSVAGRERQRVAHAGLLAAAAVLLLLELVVRRDRGAA